ncbi:MAG TPA: hypothetical protein VMU82_12565 [Acetobacteraceae bacterium]|nr:hypothetical protein [Acetobacteraceae bacterium]
MADPGGAMRGLRNAPGGGMTGLVDALLSMNTSDTPSSTAIG